MALSASSWTQNKLMPVSSKELVDGERLIDEVIFAFCESIDVWFSCIETPSFNDVTHYGGWWWRGPNCPQNLPPHLRQWVSTKRFVLRISFNDPTEMMKLAGEFKQPVLISDSKDG
jgi:hypothetical protein